MSPTPPPFVREQGAAGPAVVCLHANASSSSQWRGLMDLLAPRCRVLAPDSYGSGKSPAWPSITHIRLADEVDLIEPVLARAGEPLVLLGHSYGAAVALMAALRQPERVRALLLYEPTLFAVVDAHQPPPNDVDGIRHAAQAATAAVQAGDLNEAARRFIDYWSGPGTWAATPEARRAPVAAAIAAVARWSHALFTEPTPAPAFAALRMPLLYMLGSESPRSTRAVAERLLPLWPQAQVHRFAGLGHMGPITHPQEVNERMARFLGECDI